MSSEDDEFRVWTAAQAPANPTFKGMDGATLKVGPQVAKSVTLSRFGPEGTDEVHKVELRFRTAAKRNGGGYDWDNPSKVWACENDEIEKLRFYLNESPNAGTYKLLDSTSPEAKLLAMISSGELTPSSIVSLLAEQADFANALAVSEQGLTTAEAAVVINRRALVARLKEHALLDTSTETSLHRLFDGEWWIFGGRYVGVAHRKALSMLDEFDVPLLGADGTLHIVELKGPVIPKLVRKHRSHFIVGDQVHEATNQAMNYMRGIDEQGASLTTTFENQMGTKYDFRRVFATVVIGHPAHSTVEATESQIDQALRSYNAHLSRVQVITYKHLFDAAERSLSFDESPKAPSASLLPSDPP